MTKKERCKELMLKFFGPAAANQVDSMEENECVSKCKGMVSGFLESDKAKEFDNIV